MACDNLLWINKNTNDKELIQTAVKGIGFITESDLLSPITYRTSYKRYYRPVHLRTQRTGNYRETMKPI